MLDRTHIIHNAATGKYVCWLKIMNSDGTQKPTILTANSFLGPYEIQPSYHGPWTGMGRKPSIDQPAGSWVPP